MKTPYILSTDYAQLWELLQEGHEVAAFVTDYEQRRQPPRLASARLVSVSITKDNLYAIGQRGFLFTGKSSQEFLEDCEDTNLRWILPTIPNALPLPDGLGTMSESAIMAIATQMMAKQGISLSVGENNAITGIELSQEAEEKITRMFTRLSELSPVFTKIMGQVSGQPSDIPRPLLTYDLPADKPRRKFSFFQSFFALWK